MILNDTVRITGEVWTGEYDSHGGQVTEYIDLGEVPAHVGSPTGSTVSVASWGRHVEITELRAIVGPMQELIDDYLDLTVEWRGMTYAIEARLPVSRYGRLHHVTLGLKTHV